MTNVGVVMTQREVRGVVASLRTRNRRCARAWLRCYVRRGDESHDVRHPHSSRLIWRYLVFALSVGAARPDPSALAQSGGTASILALRQLLLAHAFTALDSAFRAREATSHGSVAAEAAYQYAFDAFSSGDTLLHAHLDAWIDAEPDVATARVARGVFFLRLATAARELRPDEELSDEARRESRRWVALAEADLRAARKLDPQGIMPLALILEIAPIDGSYSRARSVLDSALRERPTSVLLRVQLLELLSPRHYGSDSAMRNFVAAAEPHVARQPGLALLRGVADLERGIALANADKPVEAIRAYSHAIASGDYWRFFELRGMAYMQAGEFDCARADFTRALASRPGRASLLSWRSLSHASLAKRGDKSAGAAHWALALADLRLAAMLDVSDYKALGITGGQVDSLFTPAIPKRAP